MKPTLLFAIPLICFPVDGAAQARPTAPQQTRAVTVNPSFTHLQLAKAAHAKGQTAKMWQILDRAIKALPRDPKAPVTSQLRDFLATLGPLLLGEHSEQLARTDRIHRLLKHARFNHQPSKAAAIIELLAREPDGQPELQRQARHNPSPARRLTALAALDLRTVASNRRFVLRTAVIDRSKLVRLGVLDIVRPSATAEDVDYLAAGLGHASSKVRMRTAEALGNLGDRRAIGPLVKAGPVASRGLVLDGGGATTRAHVAFLRQTSYIRDFDVEVASAAFIADPKVDAIQEGAVLDATVRGVTVQRTIRRYYRRALKQLSGEDPGKDVTKWATKMSKAQRDSEMTAR